MSKTIWEIEIEKTCELMEADIASRKAVSQADAVADGISFAVRAVRGTLQRIGAPGRMLSPALWGAQQASPVDEQTVRRYIKRGELEARQGARGWEIPVGAQRIRRYDRGNEPAADQAAVI